MSNEKGMSLAQVVVGVIITLVLGTVVALSVFDYIKDARLASAKQQAIDIENNLLMSSGGYVVKDVEAKELSEDVRSVLGYHENEGTEMNGLVFEDQALKVEDEVHVGKLSMDEKKLKSFDFNGEGIKMLSGEGLTKELYVYDKSNEIENHMTSSKSGVMGEEERKGEVFAGYYHSMYLTKDGGLYVWGNGSNGRLGDGTTFTRNEPKKLDNIGKVDNVYLGSSHSFLELNLGSVLGFGEGTYGKLGTGTSLDQEEPIEINNLSGMVDIFAGDYHNAAIDDKGEVYSWGYNKSGQLGVGHVSDRKTPVKVNGLENVVVDKVSLGWVHSIALSDVGKVYSWGDNDYGQLGTGDRIAINEPKMVNNLVGVVDIAVGDQHNIVVNEEGEVYAWGRNDKGQLGVGDDSHRNVPLKVEGIQDVVSVEAGRYHTLALTSSGEVYSWGWNNHGQVGGVGVEEMLTPHKVEGLPIVDQIAVGAYHNLVIGKNGDIYGWGINSWGQLGDGTLTNSDNPVLIKIPE